MSIKNTSLFPALAQRQHLWVGPERGHREGVWYVHPEDVRLGSIGEPVPNHYIIFPKYALESKAELLCLPPAEAV